VREILVLQGSPLLGAAFAMGAPTAASLARLIAFAVASVALVSHVFLLNDWAGMSADLNDPNKADAVFATKGVRRRDIGSLGLVLLAASLALLGLCGLRTAGIGAAIALLSLLYSFPVLAGKGVPILGSALHLAGGALHFLLGYSLFRPLDGRGGALALVFALAFAAGHLNQEVRDHDGDRRNGIRTNAVSFGKTRAFVAGLAAFTLAYAQIALLAARGILPGALGLLVVLFPLHLYWSLETLSAGLTFDRICRLQARYRALFGLIGLAMLAALLLGRQ
jgi:4-hydroxybenzoate polyprenyltransferase